MPPSCDRSKVDSTFVWVGQKNMLQTAGVYLFRLTTKIEECKDPHRLDDTRHLEQGSQRLKLRMFKVQCWTPLE